MAAALHHAPILVVLLVCAIGWCTLGPFALETRADSRRRELVRAAGLASMPALLVLVGGRMVSAGPGASIFGDPLAEVLDARATPPLLVSPRAAFLLTYATIALAVGYAWRVTRPAARG